MTYIIRKRIQIDSYDQLDEEKRPPENMIWEEDSDTLNSWLRRVLSGKQETRSKIVIRDDEIEG